MVWFTPMDGGRDHGEGMSCGLVSVWLKVRAVGVAFYLEIKVSRKLAKFEKGPFVYVSISLLGRFSKMLLLLRSETRFPKTVLRY